MLSLIHIYVRGEEDAYRETVKGAVGGAAGVTHESVNCLLYTSDVYKRQPIYNVEKYLNRCLDSVMKQSFQDIEIILVNDVSTDNSDKDVYKSQLYRPVC